MKLLFPDFLIVHHNENDYVVDILKQHDPNQKDNIRKAKDFANQRKENQISGRLQLIREKKVLGQKTFTPLDMSKAEICDKVCHASRTLLRIQRRRSQKNLPAELVNRLT